MGDKNAKPPRKGQWQKGQSGNPSGLERHPPGFRALRNLTKKELIDVGNVLIKGDMEGLRRVAEDEKSPALMAMIASICLTIYNSGDMKALDTLLNRLIGKVREDIHHGGSIGGVSGAQVVVTLPSNGKEAKL